MTDEQMYLTAEEAVAALPRGQTVHTFRNPAGMLVGADWSRNKVVKAIQAASEIMITGDAAQSMKHGIAIEDDRGVLFIETADRTDGATV